MRFTSIAGLAVFFASQVLNAAGATPSVELALKFRPVQSGSVEYDIPKAADFPKCVVKVERQGKNSGWVVLGPSGETLRRYVDTNADNVVDQWRYYRHGLEVYRDMDLDFNNKVDQSRWLNTGGTRWGVDTNEDGKLDRWKRISAEETSREAIKAMSSGDVVLLSSLLIDKDDVETLGITGKVASTLLQNVSNPAAKMKAILGNTRIIIESTTWTRFDSSTSTPSLIPAEDGKASQDLHIYQSAMAIVETARKPGFVQLGELIQIGDVWKLTQIPKPIEGNSITATNVLMQPVTQIAAAPAETQISPAVRKLIEQLNNLDKQAPGPTSAAAVLGRYYASRATLLAQLARAVKDPAEQQQWTRQWADTLAVGAETGAYPKGLEQLIQMETELKRANSTSPLLSQLSYRRLRAEYSVRLSRAPADERQDVQKWWVSELQKFSTTFPTADSTPDAMLDLANTHEFTGNITDAKQWYGLLSQRFPVSVAGQRATGALSRLDLLGKSFALAGTAVGGGQINTASYRGRVMLVVYWATWCKPCLEDLPQLKALYKEYQSQGFEILGVNLDTTSEVIQPYLEQHQINWAQVHEPGGLESPPGRQFGIFTLPTMFLVDKTGKVASSNVSIAELKAALPELLKK